MRHAQSWPINPIAGRGPGEWSGWANGKKFAFVLTHDVEGKRGLDRCAQLAELDMRLGFRASFNFVPEGEYETPVALRNSLATMGFEIGVQDLRHDGRLYRSRHAFQASAQKVNHYLREWGAVGFRSGFMLHDLDWLRDLDILYDSSTFDTDPFEPQPDGVNTIFPFLVPRNNGSSYVELPYTLPQDSTLFLLFREPTVDIWKEKLDWVAQHGGLALLNVHPDYLNFQGVASSSEYDAGLYRDFLEYVAQRYGQDAWFALPREVAEHVRQRSTHSLEKGCGPAPQSVRTGSVPVMESRKPDSLLGPRSVDWNARRLQGKRVAMVLFSYYPDDPRPRRAAEALVSCGMTVDLICLQEDATDPKREVWNGVDVRRVPITRQRGGLFGYVFQYTAFLLASAGIILWRSLFNRYDLVYVHNMPDILVLSGLIPKLYGARVILDLHDPMPELMMSIFGLSEDTWSVKLLRRLEKWSMGIADSVVTVSSTFAELFAGRSCHRDKIRVVINAPDEGIFGFRPAQTGSPLQTGTKPFVIMYHGSLLERNGVHLAVDAFSRIRGSVPKAELRIYGARTPFLDQVMDSVQKQGLETTVHYLGAKSLEQIAEAIEQCDVGVIPNQKSIFTELNTPTRIFEYLAVGKPTIAPRARGICDYFDAGSIIFFELGNPEDLARKIEHVYLHPLEAAETTKRGQQIYLAHTWSRQREVLLNTVCGLFDCKGP